MRVRPRLPISYWPRTSLLHDLFRPGDAAPRVDRQHRNGAGYVVGDEREAPGAVSADVTRVNSLRRA